jgi:hypothetical protein
MFYGIIQTFDIPTFDKPTTDTKLTQIAPVQGA